VALTTNAIILNNGLTTTGGGPVTFTNAGLLTLNGNITADGAVTQNGAGTTTTAGLRNITTTNDAVSFATGVDITGGNLNVVTASGGAPNGNSITFSGPVTADNATRTLTLNAGTNGTVTLAGVGTLATPLNGLTVTTAGRTDLGGAVFVGASGLAVTTSTAGTGTGALNVNGVVTTSGGGPVTFTNAGLLTLNGDLIADGAVTQDGAGAVSITAPRTISTTSDAVNFLKAVTLTGGASGLVSIDTRVSGTGGTSPSRTRWTRARRRRPPRP